ncbi:hypothetical protein XYCOK13_24480 [Xylanibacillus composti]|uniref:J domain-containing protein n=1 Tax=Xylanibacillus composti TaxID=1572762 RepID=A0A8J4H699_9BACL|nr:hypothetical protein [Xylanibacillus composti]GIQ69624.1 hypothetical protein XYCOK13_24480 [Xylanibacillus composti]
MDDLKKAAELLGVSEHAEMEEIENRYYLIVRRHRKSPDDVPEFEAISQAYKQLKDYHLNKMMENNEVYQAEMKKSPTRRKVEHFFSAYKLHIFGTAVIVAFAGMMLSTFLNNAAEVPEDAAVMLFGAYYANIEADDEEQSLEQRMTALVPEWQRIKVQLVFAPHDQMDTFDIGMLQKAMVMLATERPDLYVMDPQQFEIVGNQGAFLPLDDYEDRLREMFGEERLVYHQYTADTQPHLYGVDLTDHPVFEGVMMDQNSKIFTIRSGVQDTSNALRIYEALAQ